MNETVNNVLVYLGERPRADSVNERDTGTPRKRKAATPQWVEAKAGALACTGARAPQLPSRAIGRLAAKLLVSPETVLYVSDISERTVQRRQTQQQPLTEAESDRVLRIARVAREAERVFGNGEKASRWLSTVSRVLGAKPLDLLGTDAGARDVEYELVRIDHGDFA